MQQPSIPFNEDIPQLVEGFRPIHYLGSKLRALPAIGETLATLDPDNQRVMDLFSGSGTVARYLSHNRPVTTVDMQEYSRILCTAMLFPSRLDTKVLSKELQEFTGLDALLEAVRPLTTLEETALHAATDGDADLISDVIQHGSIVSEERGYGQTENKRIQKAIGKTLTNLTNLTETSVIIRHFGGLYFSYKQAAFIDGIANFIGTREPEKKESILACLLSTVSDIVNTVGKQFAQPIKPRTKDGQVKGSLISKILHDRAVDAESVFADWIGKYSELELYDFDHRVIKGDFSDALISEPGFVGAVYADPPYTRDHYSRFYHVLETICLGDDPSISTTNLSGRDGLSRGVYRKERYQSPFCIRSQAPKAFARLFKGTATLDAPLILSYSPFSNTVKSHPRVMTIDRLRQIGAEYYERFEVLDVDSINHSKLNRTDLNFVKAENSEQLLVYTNPRQKGN